jgi:hypothetical protein
MIFKRSSQSAVVAMFRKDSVAQQLRPDLRLSESELEPSLRSAATLPKEVYRMLPILVVGLGERGVM